MSSLESRPETGAKPYIPAQGGQDRVTMLAITPDPDRHRTIEEAFVSFRPSVTSLLNASSLERGLSQLAGSPDPVDLVLLDPAAAKGSAYETVRSILEQAPRAALIVLCPHRAASMPANPACSQRLAAAGPHSVGAVAPLDRALLPMITASVLKQSRSLNRLLHRLQGLELAVSGSRDGLWDWDITTGEVHYSARWNAMLGLPEKDCTADLDYWLGRVDPADLPPLLDRLDSCREGKTTHMACDCRIQTTSGWYRWVLVRGEVERNVRGEIVRMAGLQTDIDERKTGELQARHQALHDPLTGVPNRTLFRDRLNHALLGLKRRSGGHFAVLYFDLDSFKTINDEHGHSAGNKVLVTVTQRFEAELRPADTLARLGGDELAVLIGEVVEPHHATQVALRLLEVLRAPLELETCKVQISASVGVALSRSGYIDADAMIHDADLAMYKAKALGGSQCRVFDPKLHDGVVALLKLERELRQAIDEHRFVVHYQPVFSLGTGKIVGFEGLVRWEHPERGLIQPGQFIALAEETGLINRLSWWVIEQACLQTRLWQERFPRPEPLWISVNLSPTPVLSPGAVERIEQILERTGLEPSSLRIEIMEKVLTDHGDAAIARLRQLRKLGVRLSVDDFGTGYSSLSYLQRFPYDVVKIDPSFTHQLDTASSTADMVETILALASRLGIGVIAEGVETEHQAHRLRQMQCPEGQGFWFARPLSIDKINQLLSNETGSSELGLNARRSRPERQPGLREV